MRKSLLVLAVLLVAPAMFAASATTTNVDNVTASVAANCTISAFTLAFGAYDPVVANAATPLDAQANVNVFCTKGTAPTSITMGTGSYGAGPTAGRFMTNGTDNLAYEVYLNSTRTTIWNTANVVAPNASTSKATALTTGGAANTAIIAYGRVPANQDVTAGAYKGTIQATVNF